MTTNIKKYELIPTDTLTLDNTEDSDSGSPTPSVASTSWQTPCGAQLHRIRALRTISWPDGSCIEIG